MKRAEPGWAVLTLAGVAAAIGSVLPFYTFGAGVELTVWNRPLFPTATFIPLLVIALALEAIFVLLMGHEPRSPFLNFTWSQARLAGTAFAMVLSLGYLVQGRAGGSLGSGYVIVSIASVASYTGAVMTRRAELARGREALTPAEHPWRAAFLRWRKDMTAKVNAYAAGGKKDTQAPAAGDAASAGAAADQPDTGSDAPMPPPPVSTIPRLSAVQSEPESEAEPEPEREVGGGEPIRDGHAARDAPPVVDVDVDAGEGQAAPNGETEAVGDAPATDATKELATEAAKEEEKADAEHAEPNTADASETTAVEDEVEDEGERQRPAAPGSG